MSAVSSSEMVRRFLETLERPPPAAEFDGAALERCLDELLGRARARWPGVALRAGDFAAHLGRHCPRAPLEFLAAVHAEDLYLAAACAAGDPAAQAIFDGHFLRRVGQELGRKPAFASDALDAVAEIRQRWLLSTKDEPGKIATYAGAGPLLAMVRAAAVRAALNLRRSRRPTAELTALDDVLLCTDPEVDFMRREYRDDFRAAFRKALADLPDERLNVLRLYAIDGLNFEKIGVAYQAHRATVARWVAETKTHLLVRTRAHLGAALSLQGEELDSVMSV